MIGELNGAIALRFTKRSCGVGLPVALSADLSTKIERQSFLGTAAIGSSDETFEKKGQRLLPGSE